MKKLLLGSAALTLLSLSILLFQISCKKDAKADALKTNEVTATQKNKIIYTKQFYSTGTRNYDYAEIWTANYDGTGQAKLNVTMPANTVIAMVDPKLSPDGQTIFFNGFTTDGTKDISNGWSLYACNIDGTNVHTVVAGAGNSNIIGVAY